MNIAPDLAASAVRFYERATIPTNSAPLARVGLTPTRVRELCEATVALTPEQVRRAMAKNARAARRGKWGRRGLPEHVWRAMYIEYQAGKSLSQVAEIFGGTRQSIFDVFRSHKLPMRPCHPRLHAKIDYHGRSYTPGKSGYYRATDGDRKMLHHQMWEDAHGPIPPGFQIAFRNADLGDIRIENLFCAPIAEVTYYHFARSGRYVRPSPQPAVLS